MEGIDRLVMHSAYVAEHQTRIIPDEIRVAEDNRLHHLIQHVSEILDGKRVRLTVLRYMGVMSTISIVRWEEATCTATEKKMTLFFGASAARRLGGTLSISARSK